MDDPRTKASPTAPADAARKGDDGRFVTSREAGGERFVSRWSRLKAEAREPAPEKPKASPAAVDPEAPPPDLPPPETLTFDSDFRPFFHPKVGEHVRRAALKKLLSDPHFNMMDGLDVYIDDYSKAEPIPAAMLAGLKQAQNIFQWAKEDAEERRKAEAGVENAAGNAGMAAALELPEVQSDAAAVPALKASEPAPVNLSDSGGGAGS